VTKKVVVDQIATAQIQLWNDAGLIVFKGKSIAVEINN